MFLSDIHSGFSLGLTNPDTILYDKNGDKFHPELTNSSAYLWNDVFVPAVNEISKFSDKDEVILITLGDLTHGKRYYSEQLTSRISDDVIIAWQNLEYVKSKMKNLVAIYNTIGTGVHNYGEGSSEMLITHFLKEKYPHMDIQITDHGLLVIGEYSIDHAHHGPGAGIRNWTKGNVAEIYLKSLMMDEIDHGDNPADLYVRGHFHEYVRKIHVINKPEKDYESEIIILPSMCMISEFAKKVGKSPPWITNGIIVKELINGKCTQTLKFTKTSDVRRKETIKK